VAASPFLLRDRGGPVVDIRLHQLRPSEPDLFTAECAGSKALEVRISFSPPSPTSGANAAAGRELTLFAPPVAIIINPWDELAAARQFPYGISIQSVPLPASSILFQQGPSYFRGMTPAIETALPAARPQPQFRAADSIACPVSEDRSFNVLGCSGMTPGTASKRNNR
jgi:hypothetical protein